MEFKINNFDNVIIFEQGVTKKFDHTTMEKAVIENHISNRIHGLLGGRYIVTNDVDSNFTMAYLAGIDTGEYFEELTGTVVTILDWGDVYSKDEFIEELSIYLDLKVIEKGTILYVRPMT